MDGKELLDSADNSIERSIACYLIARVIKSKDIKTKSEYCKLAHQLWKDNLSAAIELWESGLKITAETLSKLVGLNKINPILFQPRENLEQKNFKLIPLGGGNDKGNKRTVEAKFKVSEVRAKAII
ncbi:MAG TPA: hypothetical protein VIK72_07455 [Clostridiaceae bacterium]